MKRDVTSDAVNLASNILNSLLPKKEWEIVNIALKEPGTFTLEGYPLIPSSFGYEFDKTPIFLEQHGVILAKTIGWWYRRITSINSQYNQVKPQEIVLDGNIDDVAHINKYLRKDEIVEYFFHVPTDDIGPRKHGQMAVLVNRKVLKGFIDKQAQIALPPSDREYWYLDKRLNLKMADGSVIQANFNGSKTMRKTFETFWELWQSDGKGQYTSQQFAKKFSHMHKETPIGDRAGHDKGGLRSSILKEIFATNRLEWHYDKKNKYWIFKFFPLHNQS